MKGRKRYVIGCEVDISDKVKKNKDEYVRVAGRFWEHAVPILRLEYELDEGDVKKAKAIARIIRKVVRRKGVKLKRVKSKVLEV